MFVIGLIPKGRPDVESAALGSTYFRGRLTAIIYDQRQTECHVHESGIRVARCNGCSVKMVDPE